jgi:hypothetical protein
LGQITTETIHHLAELLYVDVAAAHSEMSPRASPANKRAKSGQIFPNFRPAFFVEKLEYSLEIFNLFFT